MGGDVVVVGGSVGKVLATIGTRHRLYQSALVGSTPTITLDGGGGGGAILLNLVGALTTSGVVTVDAASGNVLVVDTTTLVVDATNNRVGIGTATPTRPLHIRYDAGGGGAASLLGLARDSQTTHEVDFDIHVDSRDTGPGVYFIGSATTVSPAFYFQPAGSATTGVALLRTGLFGIGTATPLAPLHVRYDAGGHPSGLFRLARNSETTHEVDLDIQVDSRSASPGVYFAGSATSNNPNFYFQPNGSGTTRLAVMASGRIGIGTAAPAERVEIVGGSQLRFGSNGDSGDNSIYLRGGTTGDKAYIQLNHFGHADYILGVGGAGNGLLSLTRTWGGVDGIVIDGSGRVGIGTAAPAFDGLHVYHATGNPRSYVQAASQASSAFAQAQAGTSGADTTASLVSSGTSVAGNYITGVPYAGLSVLQFSGTNLAKSAIVTLANVPMIFGTNSVERMRLTEGGNVGVGTVAPTRTLSIQVGASATSDQYLSFMANGAEKMVVGCEMSPSPTRPFILYDSAASAYRLVINGSGQVGIGTSTPSEPFHVYKTQNGTTTAKVENPDTTNTNSRARVIVTGGTVETALTSIHTSGAFIGTNSSHAATLMTAGAQRIYLDTSGNVAIGGTSSFGSGSGVIFIENRAAAPSSNPTGGGILYVESGALKFRGSGGTVTTLANA